MAPDPEPPNRPPRLRRLAEELDEAGLPLHPDVAGDDLLLGEVDYALRPTMHERRVASFGSMVAPTVATDRWSDGTHLQALVRPVGTFPVNDARRFSDGSASWLTRTTTGQDSSIVFDRPAGSERDLVVLAEVTGATIVQRDALGTVRVVGERGVWRHDGMDWHHEPPVADWIGAVAPTDGRVDPDVLRALAEFAVHDLGARGIGALLVHRPDVDEVTSFELRMPVPPPLRIGRPEDLAPLIHALAQLDGAAVFDHGGTLRQLGVRLVPTPEAEADVDGLRGMRHTAGRRYSFDDPAAVVIVVSEDGPVTVLRAGTVLGRSDG